MPVTAKGLGPSVSSLRAPFSLSPLVLDLEFATQQATGIVRNPSQPRLIGDALLALFRTLRQADGVGRGLAIPAAVLSVLPQRFAHALALGLVGGLLGQCVGGTGVSRRGRVLRPVGAGVVGVPILIRYIIDAVLPICRALTFAIPTAGLIVGGVRFRLAITFFLVTG